MKRLALLICSIFVVFFLVNVYGPSISKELVKKQLQEMIDQDQLLRLKILQQMESNNSCNFDPELVLEMEKLDKQNTNALKTILNTYSWINISSFGQEADHNAWLLVQHADHDIEFQKKVLGMLEKLYPLKETRPDHFAYLYDRVAKNENRLQRYGTQGNIINGKWIPDEIENIEKLDAYRYTIGLPPYEQYLNQLNEHLRLDTK